VQESAAVSEQARNVPRDKEIVVYCGYGHEVGQSAGSSAARARHPSALLPGESMPGKPPGAPSLPSRPRR